MGSWIRKDVMFHEHPRVLKHDLSAAALVVADAAWRIAKAHGCSDGDIGDRWCVSVIAHYARLTHWPLGTNEGLEFARIGMQECELSGLVILSDNPDGSCGVQVRDFAQYQIDSTAAQRKRQWRAKRGTSQSVPVTERDVTVTERDGTEVTTTGQYNTGQDGTSTRAHARSIDHAESYNPPHWTDDRIRDRVTAAVNGILTCRQGHNREDPILVKTNHLDKWGPELAPWLDGDGAPDSARITALCDWAAKGQTKQARFWRKVVKSPKQLIEHFGTVEGDRMACEAPQSDQPRGPPDPIKDAENELRFATAALQAARDSGRDCEIEQITLKQAGRRLAQVAGGCEPGQEG